MSNKWRIIISKRRVLFRENQKGEGGIIIRLCPIFLSLLFLFPTLPSNAPQSGSVRIAVYDGKSGAPVENANVCVLECEKYFKTDKNGYSPTMTVDTSAHKDSPPFARAKVTLLVYKDGYVDTLVFGVEIFDGIARLGPSVRLFPSESKSDAINKQYDFPDDKLLKTIVEKYRK